MSTNVLIPILTIAITMQPVQTQKEATLALVEVVLREMEHIAATSMNVYRNHAIQMQLAQTQSEIISAYASLDTLEMEHIVPTSTNVL